MEGVLTGPQWEYAPISHSAKSLNLHCLTSPLSTGVSWVTSQINYLTSIIVWGSASGGTWTKIFSVLGVYLKVVGKTEYTSSEKRWHKFHQNASVTGILCLLELLESSRIRVARDELTEVVVGHNPKAPWAVIRRSLDFTHYTKLTRSSLKS